MFDNAEHNPDPWGFLELEAQDPFENALVIKSKKPAKVQVCTLCQGDNPTCGVCGGKGTVDVSKFKKAPVKKHKPKPTEEYLAFVDTHAATIKAMRECASWSSFAKSLVDQIDKKVKWSPKQLMAAQSMADKVAANAKKKEAHKVNVDLKKVHELFETAKGNGISSPKFKVMGMTLSMAPAHGKNPGAIYIKNSHNEYRGKVVDGKFYPAGNNAAKYEALLIEVSKDPLEQAKAFGQKTGICSCCGRKLTNAVSIEAGIGPICRENFGF